MTIVALFLLPFSSSMLFQVVVDQKMGIKILFTISSKSLTTRQKAWERERERDKERRKRERESTRGGPLSAAQDQNWKLKNLILHLLWTLVYGKQFPCQLLCFFSKFFLGQVWGAVRGWARGMFKIPNCFFLLAMGLGGAGGNREWDMGFGIT